MKFTTSKILSPIVFILALAILFLIGSTTVSAIEYNNEVITQDLTNFDWCFDNPFEKDYLLFKDNFLVYQNNTNVDLIDAKLFVRAESTQSVEVCKPKQECHETETIIPVSKNNTKEIKIKLPVCTDVTVCQFEDKNVVDWYDVEKTDLLIKSADRFCYKATRKAKTGKQFIDMNFDYKDATYDISSEKDGKLWYNSSWGKKQEINISADARLSTPTNYPIKLVLNSSLIDYADFNNDGSDLRIINSDENSSVDYYVMLWNNTGNSYVYFNATISNISISSYYLYYNSSVATTSNFNNTFTDALVNHYLVSNADANDLSASQPNDLGIYSGSQVFANNEDDIIERMGFKGVFTTDYWSLDATSSNTDYTFIGSEGFCISGWVKHTDTSGTQGITGIGNDAGDRLIHQIVEYSGVKTLYIHLNDGGSTVTCNKNTITMTDNLNNDSWNYITSCAYDGEPLTKAKFWVNGEVFGEGDCGGDLNDFTITPNNVPECIGGDCSGTGTAIRGIKGDMFDLRFYKTKPSELMTNDYAKLLFDQPSYSIGAEEIESIKTEINISVLASGEIKSVVSEGEDFRTTTNFSYFINSSNVYPLGYCNETILDVIQENYVKNVGVNTTITTSLVTDITGLDVEGFIGDYLVVDVCKDTNNNKKFMTISTNYSASYTFKYDVIPNCAVGYQRFNVFDQNSSAVTDIELTISTNGGAGDPLVLVDSRRGIDRLHNHTNQGMAWNGSVFVGEELEFYEHGTKNISVSCFANVSGIENKTDVFELIIVNKPPTIFFDVISDYFSGSQTLMVGETATARYPLLSTINISGGCADDNLFNAGYNLSYILNNTVISSGSFLANSSFFPVSLEMPSSWFSTENNYLDGLAGFEYNFVGYCNDTTNNITTETKVLRVVNDRPTASFDDGSSVLISSTPYNLSFSCNDAESETTTNYIYVNGVLNQTTTNEYFIFNYPDGAYSLDLVCVDSFRNSTNATISITYTQSCIPVIGGLITNERYRDLNQTISASCSNGVNISSCSFSVNDYAYESFNCTSDTITLEVGSNSIDVMLDDGFNTTKEIRVFAKSNDNSGFSQYIILVLFIIISIVLLWFANTKYDAGISHVFAIASIGLLGYYLIALSIWVASFIWLMAFFYFLYWLFGK